MIKGIATATVSLALLMGTTSAGAARTAAPAAALEPAAERVDGQALYGWNPLGYLLLAELLAALILLGAEWSDNDDDGPVSISP